MIKNKDEMKENLEIAESVVTIIMFVMAVWGSIVSIESGFWHKLNHVVNHYHQEISKVEESKHSVLHKIEKEIRHL